MIIKMFLMEATDIQIQTESWQPSGLFYKNHDICPINVLNDMSARKYELKNTKMVLNIPGLI